MTKDELIEHLRKLAKEEGSQRNLAKRLGVSAPFIGDVLLGKREPAPKMLKALGLRRVVTFERLEE
jgi:transcriptional regulator with XRE-family HTH domain